MEAIISQFLISQRFPVSRRYVETLIRSHPDYPSLVSVADTLTLLGVEYKMFRASQAELHRLELPYLLVLTRSGGDLVPVTSIKELQTDPSLLETWSGVVLKVERMSGVADAQNEKNRKEDRKARIASLIPIFCVVILIIIALAVTESWPMRVFTVASIIGTVLGMFLLGKELGIGTQKVYGLICGDGKRECASVTSTKYANILSILNLSEFTLVYFLSQLISILILTVSTVDYKVVPLSIAFFSIPAIFAVLYSILVQASLIKKWCRICLIVDFIVAGQALLLIDLLDVVTMVTLASSYPDVIAATAFQALVFVGCGSGVLLIKLLMARLSQATILEAKGQRIRLRPSVFRQVLSEQRFVDTGYFEHDIEAGNLAAPLRIFVVMNLYCGPCRDKLQHIRMLLDRYPKDIRFTFRFVNSRASATALQLFLAYWLQNVLPSKDRSQETITLLGDWFGSMNLDVFQKNFVAEGQFRTRAKELAELHYKWIKSIGVTETPTFFINGAQLPPEYSLEDFGTMTPLLMNLLSAEREANFQRPDVLMEDWLIYPKSLKVSSL